MVVKERMMTMRKKLHCHLGAVDHGDGVNPMMIQVARVMMKVYPLGDEYWKVHSCPGK